MRKRLRFWMIALLALGLAVWLPLSMALADDNAPGDDYPYQGRADFSLDASVSQVDTDRDRVIVTGDDGRRYTIDTYRANIVLRDTTRAGETGDLVPGMRLHITGRLLSQNIVEADRVAVLPYRGARPIGPPNGPIGGPIRRPYPDDRQGQDITLRGTVESVDDRRGSFVVHVNDHRRTIYVDRTTDFQDMDRDARDDRLPVQVGDRVTVVGFFQDDGTILARSVGQRALPGDRYGSPAPGDYPRGHQVTGRVTSESNKYTSRDIKIRIPAGREVAIKVPHGATIRRGGRAISVHDLHKNDVIRVDGSFDGDDFKASRITVLRSYEDDYSDRGDDTYRDDYPDRNDR